MKLLIVGCGGHGCNCLEIARTLTGSGEPLFDDIAFADDNHVGESICDCNVICKVSEVDSVAEQFKYAFVAIGNNEIRMRITQGLIDAGYRIATLISPKANVSLYSQIGEGCVVFPFATVEQSAIVADGVVLDTGVVIGHNSKIENYSLVYANSVVRPYSLVESVTTIKANSVIDNQRGLDV